MTSSSLSSAVWDNFKIVQEVVILDMGDNYIISQKGPEYDAALALYSEIDVSIVNIPTRVVLTPEALKFVQRTLGRILVSDRLQDRLQDRLINDIRVTSTTYDAQRFWKQYHVSRENEEAPYESVTVAHNNDEGLYESVTVPAHNDVVTLVRQWTITALKCILFNTLYNVSIVVDESKFIQCKNGVEGFLYLFPEFELVAKDLSSQENLISIFHRRTYESIQEVKAKYDAYECLYGPPKQQGILGYSEKKKIAKILTDNFDLSDSIDDRIKASELYAELAGYIYPLDMQKMASFKSFKKRVSGYLIEHSLKKKRFSDAYYYYGIRKKTEATSVVLPSLEEVERLRAAEMNLFS